MKLILELIREDLARIRNLLPVQICRYYAGIIVGPVPTYSCSPEHYFLENTVPRTIFPWISKASYPLCVTFL